MCVYIHPIMIKNPPSVFFKNPYFKIPFLKSGCSCQNDGSSAQAPPTIVDWQGRLTLDLPWVSWELSASVQRKTRLSPIKRLRRSVVGCNNEYSSRHLLPTSQPLKTQRITFGFWRECASVNFVNEDDDEKYLLTTFFLWLRRDVDELKLISDDKNYFMPHLR